MQPLIIKRHDGENAIAHMYQADHGADGGKGIRIIGLHGFPGHHVPDDFLREMQLPGHP